MRSINDLKRELWFWKQVRKRNLNWLQKELNLPPSLRNEEGIEYINKRIDRIETSIWQLKTRLEEFSLI